MCVDRLYGLRSGPLICKLSGSVSMKSACHLRINTDPRSFPSGLGWLCLIQGDCLTFCMKDEHGYKRATLERPSLMSLESYGYARVSITGRYHSAFPVTQLKSFQRMSQTVACGRRHPAESRFQHEGQPLSILWLSLSAVMWTCGSDSLGNQRVERGYPWESVHSILDSETKKLWA